MDFNSRTPSGGSYLHAPSTPSGLRQSYIASPESSPEVSIDPRPDPSSSSTSTPGARSSYTRAASESTALLRDANEGPWGQGTFSPRAESPSNSFGPSNNASQSGSRAPSLGNSSESSLPIIDSVVAYVSAKGAPDWRRRWAKRMRTKTMGRSSELAERHGVEDNAFMCVYMPMRPIPRDCVAVDLKGRRVLRRIKADGPFWIGTSPTIFRP